MYIFGFGSLVDIDKLAQYLGKSDEFKKNELYICKLIGYRRIWNVAMDNSKTLPNYKYYLEKINNENKRLDYFVTFLNIEYDLNSEIVGVLFFVDDKMLEKLTLRERNYDLLEITDNLDISIDDKAFVFVAKEEGANRYKNGLSKNLAVVPREYYNFVRESYSKLEKNKYKWEVYFSKKYKEDFLETYDSSTYLDENVKIKDLVRINTDSHKKNI